MDSHLFIHKGFLCRFLCVLRVSVCMSASREDRFQRFLVASPGTLW